MAEMTALQMLRMEFPPGSLWRHYRNGKSYRILRYPAFQMAGAWIRLVEYEPEVIPVNDDGEPWARTPEDFRRSFTRISESGTSER
jgi:hypothetical protein